MSFPARWDDGTTATGPDHQVHRYDERTVIIRQALRTNFEGPFLYLLLGTERALLLDTGTGHADLRPVVDELIGERELVVAHTHAHGDHVGGDDQFDQVVGHSAEEVAAFFGIADWPHGIGRIDLGERVLDVIPIPGHQGADIALYDRETRLLLTGDSLYPGRLYVPDWTAYRASIRRLAGFVAAGNPVEHVLGAHIEMPDRPGEDYPMGAVAHPDEHPLQLAPETLTELDEALTKAGPEPRRLVHDHFIVYPR
ncbi:MBL fold metallo-hydrolase [Kribbella sp. NPDC051770]|uniref:MBL fold metallo-hydrolase n=1 Tax=Kribbella sp. NPDC051770 TaxID=3155413 RepID=UPI00342E628A